MRNSRILCLGLLAFASPLFAGGGSTCVQNYAYLPTSPCDVHPSDYKWVCEQNADAAERPHGLCTRYYSAPPCYAGNFVQITAKDGTQICVYEDRESPSSCVKNPKAFGKAKNGGNCNCIPGGCYRIGGGGYYSNGSCHSCWIQNMPQFNAMCAAVPFDSVPNHADHEGNIFDGPCS